MILALCTQEVFKKVFDKANRRVEREKKAKIREEKKAQALTASLIDKPIWKSSNGNYALKLTGGFY